MGSVNLDNTGSGSAVTLSSDGTDLLLDGTAVGGGPTFYAETFTSGDPLPTATGTSCFAIGAYSSASAFGTIALGYDVQATSLSSTAIGRNSSGQGSRTATGQGAMALGGSRASGTDSFAAAIANNTSSYGATGANSVAMGPTAKASGGQGIAMGFQALASGARAFAVSNNANATGTDSLAIGRSSSASATNSVALGKGPVSSIVGKFAYAAHALAGAGSSQTGTFVLLTSTTDATPKAVSTNNSTAGTTNQIILPNNSAYFFSGTIIAREQASSGTDVGAWEIKGAIRREANAASTVLIKSTIDDFNVPTGWVVALTADTTNGGLAVTVTGAASTNIRWVGTVTTSEVTY